MSDILDEKLINYGGLNHFYDELKTNDLDNKQDKLIAGEGIAISGNTISAEGYTYDSSKNSFGETKPIYTLDNAKIVAANQSNLTITTDIAPSDIVVNDGIATEEGGDYVRCVSKNGTTITVERWLSSFVAGANLYEVYGNKALGDKSHSEGISTWAYGNGSHAEGLYNVANGNYNHVEGRGNITSATSSHAEGYNNKVTRNYSHAEGANNIVNSLHSHVEGSNNSLDAPTGSYNHFEGYNNTFEFAGSQGDLSGAHVEGMFNKPTVAFGLHMQGIAGISHHDTTPAPNNKIMSSNKNSAFVIGGGSGVNDKKNAFEVMQGGDVYIRGLGNYTGIDTKYQDSSIQTLQEVINEKADKNDIIITADYQTEVYNWSELNNITETGVYRVLVQMLSGSQTMDVANGNMYVTNVMGTVVQNIILPTPTKITYHVREFYLGTGWQDKHYNIPIINDATSSSYTTYSSNKIESLISELNSRLTALEGN